MLFPYTFLPHQMDTMQEYVRFILEEVWCNAESGMAFDIAILFAANPDLCDMVTELHTQELKGADSFLTSLQALFEAFKPLDADQKQQFRMWFQTNNNIQQLCEQGLACQPATYSVIEDRFPNDQFPGLVQNLRRFYKNLYSDDFLKLASVRSRIGEIGDHNNQFTAQNDRDICPFCGLSNVLGQYNTKREAYDHYFPKDKYPFNSINFYNLVPACPHCNSSYKLAKNPLFTSSKNPLATQRRVFYPFSLTTYDIDLTINITHLDWKNLKPDNIKIEFGPAEYNSEIGTWDDVYGIKERYSSMCCSRGAGKAWLTEIFEVWKSPERNLSDYLDALDDICKVDRFPDMRFLKKAFLDGCQRGGLFDL